MFLETTPEGKIYKELAADHFADPKGLGKYAITLEGRNLFATRDFYAFFKHLEETGIEATHKGVVVIAMNKLREVMLETPEVLDNARLTADGRNLYLIKNKSTNIG